MLHALRQTASLTRRSSSGRRGQGMTEYIIIVALVAIAAVGIVTTFGNNIRQLFDAAVDVLNGTPSASNTVGAGINKGTFNIKNFGATSNGN